MLRTILVPLDGSTYAEHALIAARHIAGRTGATVMLAHVVVPEGEAQAAGPDGAPPNAEQRSRQMNYLTARCCELVACDVEVGCNLLDGPVTATLVEHARALDAELAVMTTHGRGAFSRAWLGSVVDDVVRHLPVPTLLIRPEAAAEQLRPSVDQPWNVRRMLVPLDGSAAAEQILAPVTELAGALGAAIVLLRIVAPGAATAAEQAYVDAVAARLRDLGLPVEARVAAAQHVAAAILGLVERDGCDLIALATHGRGGLARLVLGSVADKVVRGAHVPVLLLRPT